MRLFKSVLRLKLVYCLLAASDAGAQLAPFSVEHLFMLESVGDKVTFSPDGALAVFAVKRAIRGEFRHHEVFANDRSDVWLHDVSAQRRWNLTNGASDGSDFWYPAWSPDGSQLAMLSSRRASPGDMHVWIWDRKKNALTRLSEILADIDNDVVTENFLHKIHWFSNNVLAFRSRPSNVRASESRTVRQFAYDTAHKMLVAAEGDSTTATIFESGRDLSSRDLTHGEKYVSCNVEKNVCTELLESFIGNVHDVWTPTELPAPSDEIMGVFGIDGSVPGDPKRRMHRFTTLKYRLQLFDSDRARYFGELAKIGNVVPGSLRWSSDSYRLVFIGSNDRRADLSNDQRGADMGPQEIYELDLASGKMRKIAIDDLQLVSQELWGLHRKFGIYALPNANWIVHAERRNPSSNPVEGWWAVGSSRDPVNVTSRLTFVPAELIPVGNGAEFICAGKGNVWHVSTIGAVSQLTHLPADSSMEVLWTDHQPERGEPITSLIYRTTAKPDFVYHLDVERRESSPIQVPSADSQFVGFSGVSRTAVFRESSRSGTRLWIARADAAPTSVFVTNTFLNSVGEGDVVPMEYVSLEGEALRGWLVLPHDYEVGTKYPAVVWVYLAEVYGSDRPRLAQISTLSALNLQLFASRGFVVILPSMPTRFINDYPRLLNGVSPAIDKAIELGIVDGSRLAIAGHSNGGYSTYGIVTQTNRFKAAIAMAGMTDLFSIALQFEPPLLEREVSEVGVTSGRLASFESSMNIGLPWRSSEYQKYSPIMYVDRVQTPVLQLHGDLDGAPVQQAEEFFTAMQRLGKRAKFVRYVGEGHVFHSPANIRHSWEQIYRWLDEHLKCEHGCLERQATRE